MKLEDIVLTIGGRILSGDDLVQVEVSSIIASDMMSDVLRYSRQGSLLVTGNTNIQSVRTVLISELAGVIFVRSKTPDARTQELARGSGVFIAVTELDTFDVCGKIYEKMGRMEILRPAAKV